MAPCLQRSSRSGGSLAAKGVGALLANRLQIGCRSASRSTPAQQCTTLPPTLASCPLPSFRLAEQQALEVARVFGPGSERQQQHNPALARLLELQAAS